MKGVSYYRLNDVVQALEAELDESKETAPLVSKYDIVRIIEDRCVVFEEGK